jgi:hypothetical protein
MEEDEEPPTADAEGLRRFLEAKVLPWFEVRKKELASRPLIRDQALGEALDPDKLERLGRYEVHLDRKLERIAGHAAPPQGPATGRRSRVICLAKAAAALGSLQAEIRARGKARRFANARANFPAASGRQSQLARTDTECTLIALQSMLMLSFKPWRACWRA